MNHFWRLKSRRLKRMRFRPKSSHSRGFTLLELLVVMILIGLTVGLAVPRMLTAVEAIAADAELRNVAGMMDQMRLRAYLRGKSQTLLFEDRYVRNSDLGQAAVFEHIRFPFQQIHWNTRGFPDVRLLDYTSRGREGQIALY